MENHVQISFEKLFIPLIEINTCVCDLVYNNKKYRFAYPLKAPLDIYLSPKFQNDTQLMTLTVMIIVGNKYKKICRGDIHLYKKYFLGDKTSIEKWLYLTLFQTQLESMGHNTDIIKAELNKGKIYMNLNILDPVELKKNILIKDPITANKTERYRSIVENSNAFLKKIKSKKTDEIMEDLYEDLDEYAKMGEFDDGLSDLSISIIDLNEEGRDGIDIAELANGEYLQELNNLIKEDAANILPKDSEDLIKMNEDLYQQYILLKTQYNETLSSMNKETEEMRIKAKDFYEKYKIMKAEIYKRRKALKEKKKELKEEIANNSETNKKVLEGVKGYHNDLDFLKTKLNLKKQVDEENLGKNEDIEQLSSIVNKLSSLGINIYNVCNLSEKEKQQLKTLLGVEDKQVEQKEEVKNELKEEDDVELGNTIISYIENDVNTLYSNKKIKIVKIDQLDATHYSFEDETGSIELQIELKIKNDSLICSDGTPFIDWLKANFGL